MRGKRGKNEKKEKKEENRKRKKILVVLCYIRVINNWKQSLSMQLSWSTNEDEQFYLLSFIFVPLINKAHCTNCLLFHLYSFVFSPFPFKP
jgi:peptidoglycan/LPS O-acetylase OafA/YrhL